jgi:hypothetical protein
LLNPPLSENDLLAGNRSSPDAYVFVTWISRTTHALPMEKPRPGSSMKKGRDERINSPCCSTTRINQAGLTTAPERMQRVHTLAWTVVPSAVTMRTFCRLGSQRRRVLLWAGLTLLPVDGPLPQISQLRAIMFSPEKIVVLTKCHENDVSSFVTC